MEAAKKLFSVTRSLRGGWAVKAWPLRKNNFLKLEKKTKKNVATKLEGGLVLSARATKKDFFAASPGYTKLSVPRVTLRACSAHATPVSSRLRDFKRRNEKTQVYYAA